MKTGIYAVGRLKSGPERDLAQRYLDRFAKAGRCIGLEWTGVVELNESRAGNPKTRKREEGCGLAIAIPSGALVIALDECGHDSGSQAFAGFLEAARDQGRREMAIVIGGADGLDSALRDKADMTLALGRMTWPHQIVRILIAEQLYRAATILSGHPYHRA